MPKVLDHILYAGPDRDGMIEDFARLSGVRAGIGGVHPGLGTHNALVSLGPHCYFELIATDPAQDVPGSMGDLFRRYDSPRLFAYMVRASDLEGIRDVLAEQGIAADLFAASRQTPDGRTLRWRLLMPDDNRFGNCLPKFIDWLDTPLPGGSAVPGCSLIDFHVGHPDAHALSELLGRLDIAIDLAAADRPCLRARLRTPNGVLIMNSAF
jgi:hypothetical protein